MATTMNYELAKNLKDAGFPQNLDGNKQMNGKPMMFYSSEGDCYVPILEEVIEACGDDFVSLDKKEQGIWEACGKYYCCDEHGEGRKFSLGSTPLEAVANLYLALHGNTKATKTS